jgi:ribonuclease T1
MTNLRTNLVAALAAVLVMTIAVFLFTGNDTTAVSSETGDAGVVETTDDLDSSATTAQSSTTGAAAIAIPTVSDLPTIAVEELPIEAIETLALIDAGGPYPYRQDDGIFQNREQLLPSRSGDHYREYTVDTPGSPDRGARRIVTGADGERYWTDDHYDSFREIVG